VEPPAGIDDAPAAPGATEPTSGSAEDAATHIGTSEEQDDDGADVGSDGGSDQVSTGFQLTPGQEVVALVRGQWRPAVVVSRDRRTVVVDYQLASGPLGSRRQRVAIDRVRLTEPTADPGARIGPSAW
jgi:hypothetical protein